MTYVRKTKDIWEIQTNYGYGWEVENTEENLVDAKRSLKEYRENSFGRYSTRLVKKRIKTKEE